MMSGLFEKCASGSPVEKVSIPIPIPAPNSIENHESRENSGASPGPPILSEPVCGISASAARVRIRPAMR